LQRALPVELTNYNEFLTFATKNHIRSVSDYAVSNGFTNFDEEFEKFKTDFEKQYTTEEVELRKFHFLKSLEYIESHNELYKKGEVHHELGVNHLADWTPDEYKQMQIPEHISMNFTEAPLAEGVLYANLPASFDWRAQNKVTPVKNQGSCGSCYTFSSCAAVEAAYAIKNNQFISLSEQNILDCSSNTKYQNNGCNYGYLNQAFQYILDNGVELSNAYPYAGRLAACQNSATQSHVRISGYNRVGTGDLDMMNAVYSHGPISVSVDSSGNDFMLYKGGIISTGTQKINHFILLVGWGTQNGVDYWIVKNSWSTSWGEAGYGRLIRGKNIRNINANNYYPVL